MNLCLRIRAPRLLLNMSQPAETVWNKQLQRFDQLGWVFQKGATASFRTFLFFRFQYFSPRNELVSVDGLWAPLFLKFVCYCKVGALCELVCEQLFFHFQQNSCFSLSFIGIEKLLALTRITYASVSDIERKKIDPDTPWTFPKRLLSSFSPDYRSRISKKGWNFYFFLKKIFFTKKRTVAKSILDLVE